MHASMSRTEPTYMCATYVVYLTRMLVFTPAWPPRLIGPRYVYIWNRCLELNSPFPPLIGIAAGAMWPLLHWAPHKYRARTY